MGRKRVEDNKQRFGCIYLLTNLITLLCYVGKTIDFEGRMEEHENPKETDKTYIHRSIRKHGWHNFKVEILIDDVPEEDLNNLETCYIAVKNTMVPNGYNLTRGGEGTSGYKFTAEQRKNCSQAAVRREANRDRVGCVFFNKWENKYQAIGPGPESKSIGYYFTKKKGEDALKHYLKTGERIESDRTQRKKGTGTIQKRGKRYVADYKKNKKRFTKRFDTVDECEEWLKTELKL
jgi:group I intron endonuclease